MFLNVEQSTIKFCERSVVGWFCKKQNNSFWVGNIMKKMQLALKSTCYELHFAFGGTYIKNEEKQVL